MLFGYLSSSPFSSCRRHRDLMHALSFFRKLCSRNVTTVHWLWSQRRSRCSQDSIAPEGNQVQALVQERCNEYITSQLHLRECILFRSDRSLFPLNPFLSWIIWVGTGSRQPWCTLHAFARKQWYYIMASIQLSDKTTVLQGDVCQKKWYERERGNHILGVASYSAEVCFWIFQVLSCVDIEVDGSKYLDETKGGF